MKVLLDENIDGDLKQMIIGDFEIFTLNDMDWLGSQNGDLREKLNINQFTFLITSDKNLPFQQNLKKTRFTIVMIDTLRLGKTYQYAFVPKLQILLDNPPANLPKLIHIKDDAWYNYKLIAKLEKLLPPDQILFI